MFLVNSNLIFITKQLNIYIYYLLAELRGVPRVKPRGEASQKKVAYFTPYIISYQSIKVPSKSVELFQRFAGTNRQKIITLFFDVNIVTIYFHLVKTVNSKLQTVNNCIDLYRL